MTPGAVPDLSGTYKIRNVNSGQYLDASGGKDDNGTPLIQWPSNSGTNQQWTLALNSDGYYTVSGVPAPHRNLDIPNVTTWPGTQVQLWDPNSGPNQQWEIAPTAVNGNYTFESRSDGYMLEVTGQSWTFGAAVDQWPTNGGANQQWQLEKVG